MIGALAAVLVSPAVAVAQPQIEDAKRLFAEGEQAEQAGDCDGAVAKWRAVLAIKETPQIHLRIGRCEEKLGHLSKAIGAYEKATDLAAGNTAVLDVAKQQIAALDARVPKLTVVWDASLPGASVQLDGASVENGKPARVDPGKHAVRATAPGRTTFTKTVDLAEGQAADVKVELRLAESSTEPPPPGTTEEGAGLSPWPFVIMGGGLVALGVAIPLAVIGQSDLDEVYTHCGAPDADGHRTCPKAYEDDVSAVRVKYGVAGALGAVSGIALGVGATLLVLDLTRAPEHPSAEGWTVLPWVGPGGAGAAVAGRF
ncbi:MAG TPA: hypothetical protein VL400_22205 [Polyangiaceae bacterium]|nr:hypothetical protein [Polyangiaceae bacterium]